MSQSQVTVYAGSQPVMLREAHDLSFLEEYGSVFRVFDRLVSGNVCFGVRTGEGAGLFLKYAGASALRYAGDPQDAVRRLREQAALYERLRHPALLSLLKSRETAEGFLCVFPWFDGLPLSPLQEQHRRLREKDLLFRLRMYDRLADLHAQAEAMGLLFAGLDEASLLFDEPGEDLRLCTLSHFFAHSPGPRIARLPGNPWYLSPEAYRPDGRLDESAGVYTLGALAFTFFGDRTGHSKDGWEGSEGLLRVALRATLSKREQRFPDAGSFLRAWREAVFAAPL